ncbi:PQQ-dependent sugar dehydrogenase [Halalkalicoccus salilacus]|uniref:PQQ-dependent sugar dehydrogenase n=1 Tax=Halalkalicoccus salilacus TaxID=3117459 RepID=UPI00300F445C
MERPTNRRRFLAAAVAGTTAGLAGCSVQPPIDEDAATSDPTQAATELPDTVDLETLATGLEMPVSIAFTPDADRRYIAQRRGRILVHESAETRDEPLLDLSEAVMTGGERGLLGIALHPEFSEDRRLFVRYSAEPRSGTPSDYSHTFVLAEFQVSEDGRRAEPASERAVLEIPQPRERHNAGDLAFGPNGHLYVPVGDSAAAPDLAWQGPGTGGYAQDVTENLLGSVLRIDVDDRAEGEGYSVPVDNPLVGREGLDEHYAWGFRNPWRLSFDGSDLYVADVGKDHFEEVNLVERGGNYGWNVKEGTHCFQVDDCPDETPENVRGGEPLLDPIVEYSHSGGSVSGVTVIGGYVYRGSTLSELDGVYVFGDLQPEGRLFAATRPENDDGLWPINTIEVAGGEESLQQILSFGRDTGGELYVLRYDGGGLFRVVPAS